jgi:hypothetical protein
MSFVVKSVRPGVALLFTVLIIMACNEKKEDQKLSDNSAAETQPVVIQPAIKAFSGKLDTLVVDSLSFSKLPNAKMVFSFVFGENDTLTLHGWHAKGLLGTSFDSLPDIKLIKGNPSHIDYGPGIYFGNVILKDVNKIQRALKTHNAQLVIFAPKMVDTNHIGYDIFLGKNDPTLSKISILAIINIDLDANPSPPKTYN